MSAPTPNPPLVPLPLLLPMDKSFMVDVRLCFQLGFPEKEVGRDEEPHLPCLVCPQLLPLTAGSGQGTAPWG